ncbi:very short patch repair endonuclease [Variovorax sp. LT1R20]|uniref:very short patch repair endonuclease n=1 Tax=Variovorax sp. LT1R20 TaxID=3443729 RepID=UPI003F464523
MADFLSKDERSIRMARIRGKDTRPELALRRELHKAGLRFRLHDKKLPGRPDLVFHRYRSIVFVNGCFWHRHENCKVASTPKTNIDFWLEKFEKNVARDKKNIASLEGQGWRVFLVWECELSPKNLLETTQKIAERIRENAP